MKENKVLFVHDGPLYQSAGGGFYSRSFSDKVVERYYFFGKTVSFLMRKKELPNKSGANFSRMTHSAFRFIEIPDFKSPIKFAHKRKAKRIINKAVQDHDIIIVRIPSAAGTIAFNYAKKYGKPVLVECVACVFDALWNYNWLGKMMAHYKYLQMKKLMSEATHSIYVTNEFLQSRYPTEGKSIGCSDVLLKPMTDDILESRLDKVKNREESPLILGTVAALNVPYKGQGDVIKAIGELKREGFRVDYKLVGQGDAMRLKNLSKKHGVEDRVEIIGPLRHEKVFTFLDNIDVYIQPSRQEGLPRAMVEAMSRACLMMGANTAGIPELIENRFIFEAGNTGGINSILRKIDNHLLKEQAKRNFEEAKRYQGSVLNKRRKSFYKEFSTDFNLL